MPIDAKFTADFSQFTTATKGAQTELDKLITKSDGTARAIGKSFQSASTATQDWTKDLGKFDGILSAAGINISSQVRAITELNTAMGAASGSMSLVATAGVAVGVALAAWNLTKIIEETFGLDQKIADLATTMGLFPSVATATKEAIDETIHRAIMAGGNVTTYAEAVKYLTEQQKENNLVMGYSRTPYRDSLLQMAAWDKEIETVNARGHLRQLNADLEANNLKLPELSRKYGVHVEALQYYQRELTKAAELEKAEAKQLKEDLAVALEAAKVKTEAFATAWKDIASQDLGWMTKAATGLQGMIDKFDVMVLSEMEAAAELAAFKSAAATIAPDSLEGLTLSYDQLTASLDASGASAKKQELAYLKYQEAFLGAIPPVKELGDKSQETGAKTEQAGRQAAGAVAGYQALGTAVQYAATSFQNMYTQVGHATGYEGSLRTMNDMMSEYGRAGVPVHGGLIPGAPHRATGGPVASGSPYWVGERGPELFVPKTSGAIIPAGGGGGVTVNVYGSVLSTQRELAMLVEEAMMRTYRQGGNRQPV